MADSNWEELRGRQLRYLDHTWELTGTVDVLDRGELLAVEATQVDDVRGRTARLLFGLQDPPASLNPGNLGGHFDRLERVGDGHHLVVNQEPRSYRYALHRMEYD